MVPDRVQRVSCHGLLSIATALASFQPETATPIPPWMISAVIFLVRCCISHTGLCSSSSFSELTQGILVMSQIISILDILQFFV